MTEHPTLAELARRVMTHEFGEIHDSEALALAAVNAYATFLTSVSSLVGVIAGVALLRRSLRHKEAASVPYSPVLADEQNGLLNALGLWLRTQPPDAAREASIVLLSHYLELVDTFIGDHLTRQLVHDAWPELRMPSSKEKPA
jgi:hypothetical protein